LIAISMCDGPRRCLDGIDWIPAERRHASLMSAVECPNLDKGLIPTWDVGQ